MITRLEVDGFKSLRNFAVDLEPVTVFIGPNSAGKSNVLDALALLSRLAFQPVEDAFKAGRGRALDQFTHHKAEAGLAIRFAAEIFAPGVRLRAGGSVLPYNRYRYEVVIARRPLPSGAESFAIEEERVLVLDRASDRWAETHPDLAPAIHHPPNALVGVAQTRETLKSRRFTLDESLFPGESLSPGDEIRVPRTHTALAATKNNIGHYIVHLPMDPEVSKILDTKRAGSGLSRSAMITRLIMDASEPGTDVEGVKEEEDDSVDLLEIVADELSAYRLFHIGAAQLRATSERLGSGYLASDASNLPTVLANISPPTLGELRADLVALVPGISSFEVVPEGDAFRIDFELSGGEHLPARLLSDGTLRILALLTALRIEPRPSVVGIEEPENGVFPGRLQKLIDYLQENAAGGAENNTRSTQLVLTTHSPVVLAAMHPHPERLRFVDLVRRGGQLITRARTVGAIASSDRGRSIISLRDVEEILHAPEREVGG